MTDEIRLTEHTLEKPRLADFGVVCEEYKIYKYATRGKGHALDVHGKSLSWPHVVAKQHNTTENALCIATWASLISMFISFSFIGSLWGVLIVTATPWVVVCVINRTMDKKVKTTIKRVMESDVPLYIDTYEALMAVYLRREAAAERARKEAEKLRHEALRAKREAERVKHEAERARLRQAAEYWHSLGGIEFEQELAVVFRRLGYQVNRTPPSGDQGVDLILRRNGRIGIVQCKRYTAPAGPAVVRELLGSMVAYPADYAVLACTGGFTRNVYEFAHGKQIYLWSVYDIVEWATRAEAQATNNSRNTGDSPTLNC